MYLTFQRFQSFTPIRLYTQYNMLNFLLVGHTRPISRSYDSIDSIGVFIRTKKKKKKQ